MSLNQYQDNGKTVGCLGGKLGPIGTGAPFCFGGAQFVTHSINYNNFLPNIAARYSLKSNWSVYGQFAEGSVIPLSSVLTCRAGMLPRPPSRPWLRPIRPAL